jgi:hypothetical protein
VPVVAGLLKKAAVQPVLALGYDALTNPAVLSATLAPPPVTMVPAGQVVIAVTAVVELDVSTGTVVDTYVTFEIDAELALVALVALVAFVAVSAVDACFALGTVPSEPSLILLPCTDRLRSRFPDSELFLISESPLTSLVAATAVPEAATTSAIIATTIAADGLRRRPKRCLMAYPLVSPELPRVVSLW